MRFQVPQFVDIEDRVIGPLTLKQFAFYLLAAMILGILYVIVDLGLLIILALPIVGVAVLFAHARFFGQPFGVVLLNAINYYMGAKLYLWRRVEKEQPLKISGNEYGYGSEGDDTVSSIDLMNQALNTEGNVVEADAADPLLDEDETTGTAALAVEEEDKEDSQEEPKSPPENNLTTSRPI